MDFFITPKGDLAFTESNRENSQLKISFFKTGSAVIRINMEAIQYRTIEPQKNGLTIILDYTKRKNNKRAITVKNNALLAQKIMIRLKTALGELPLRRRIGSTLETVMHANLNDKSIIKATEIIVAEAIKDILPGCIVKAEPAIIRNGGYSQVMNIKIYQDDEFIMTYQLEG